MLRVIFETASMGTIPFGTDSSIGPSLSRPGSNFRGRFSSVGLHPSLGSELTERLDIGRAANAAHISYAQ
jgi:hypothetical protein